MWERIEIAEKDFPHGRRVFGLQIERLIIGPRVPSLTCGRNTGLLHSLQFLSSWTGPWFFAIGNRLVCLTTRFTFLHTACVLDVLEEARFPTSWEPSRD